MAETYTVSTWDIDEDDWQAEYRGLSKWQIRDALRELYGCGWTPITIQVKAETHLIPAARWERGFRAETTTLRQRKELRAMYREARERQPLEAK